MVGELGIVIGITINGNIPTAVPLGAIYEDDGINAYMVSEVNNNVIIIE